MTTLRERFEAKISYEPMSGCWLWMGATNPDGYGNIGTSRSRASRAHRVAWEMANGPIPDGMQIDHRCHCRSCVNPEHLRLATSSENNRNSLTHKDSRSGLKGAYFHPKRKRWVSAITYGGKTHWLGRFLTKEEAHKAYCDEAFRVFGEFANSGGSNDSNGPVVQ